MDSTTPARGMRRTFVGIATALAIALAVVLGSTVVKVWPASYFWVERENARMPVWVRGNIASGTFVILNHGGPGSSGTAESIFEVTPGNGRPDHPSPLQALESRYAMVYWDQRCSGMARGSADPDDSTLEDFGQDLAAVIESLQARYEVEHIFLIGQSWGHVVSLSYMTFVPGWRDNQARIDGYIGYKGNHEANAPYRISRLRILAIATRKLAAGEDVAYWRSVRRFHEQNLRLSTPGDFAFHSEAVYKAQGGDVPLARRVWSSLKASVFSPFNGWEFYFNNRKIRAAKNFWAWITTDATLSRTVSRLRIPVLLIYGGRDLVAPPEIGRGIYDAIGTPEGERALLVLPNSRHGAEGQDVVVMQNAIRAFIDRTIASGRR